MKLPPPPLLDASSVLTGSYEERRAQALQELPTKDLIETLKPPDYAEGERLPSTPRQQQSESAYLAEKKALGNQPKRTEQLESAIDYGKEGLRAPFKNTPEGYMVPSLESYEKKVQGEPISLRKKLFERQKHRSS